MTIAISLYCMSAHTAVIECNMLALRSNLIARYVFLDFYPFFWQTFSFRLLYSV